MEVDFDDEIKQEPTAEDEMEYKDAVDKGQQEADAYSHFSVDETEVDFGDEDEEQDVEMNQAEQEESEEEGDMQDEDPRVRKEEERKQKAHAELMTQYPK